MAAAGNLRTASRENGRIVGVTKKDVKFRDSRGNDTTLKIVGVGDKILKKIASFLETGGLPQADALREEVLHLEDNMSDRAKSEDVFRTVHGIDILPPRYGRHCMRDILVGWFTIEDLKNNHISNVTLVKYQAL